MVAGSARPLLPGLYTARKVLPSARVQFRAAAIRSNHGHKWAPRPPSRQSSNPRYWNAGERHRHRHGGWRCKQQFVVLAAMQGTVERCLRIQLACKRMYRQRGLLDLRAYPGGAADMGKIGPGGPSLMSMHAVASPRRSRASPTSRRGSGKSCGWPSVEFPLRIRSVAASAPIAPRQHRQAVP